MLVVPTPPSGAEPEPLRARRYRKTSGRFVGGSTQGPHPPGGFSATRGTPSGKGGGRGGAEEEGVTESEGNWVAVLVVYAVHSDGGTTSRDITHPHTPVMSGLCPNPHAKPNRNKTVTKRTEFFAFVPHIFKPRFPSLLFFLSPSFSYAHQHTSNPHPTGGGTAPFTRVATLLHNSRFAYLGIKNCLFNTGAGR